MLADVRPLHKYQTQDKLRVKPAHPSAFVGFSQELNEGWNPFLMQLNQTNV